MAVKYADIAHLTVSESKDGNSYLIKGGNITTSIGNVAKPVVEEITDFINKYFPKCISQYIKHRKEDPYGIVFSYHDAKTSEGAAFLSGWLDGENEIYTYKEKEKKGQKPLFSIRLFGQDDYNNITLSTLEIESIWQKSSETYDGDVD